MKNIELKCYIPKLRLGEYDSLQQLNLRELTKQDQYKDVAIVAIDYKGRGSRKTFAGYTIHKWASVLGCEGDFFVVYAFDTYRMYRTKAHTQNIFVIEN